MSSSVASAILRRTSSLRRSNISGLRDSLRSNDGSYKSNEYILLNFFEGENYLSIIKCLDGGYEVAIDLIGYMQDYLEILQDLINSLNSFSTKWRSKLKNQSSISSYNTTKRAQIQTIRSSEKLAQLIQTRCDAIQQVITAYKKQVDKMYPSERLGTVHKHYRSEIMRKLFKNARASSVKVSEELDKLHEKEKRAQSELLDARIQYQNLELNETTSKTKLTNARTHQEDKQRKLELIQEKIVRTEEDYNREREIYRTKALEIYEQCRVLEQERLEQIRQTLINFTQAIHSTEYSDGLDALYDGLLLNIKSDQDTLADLAFWEQTYHVNISTPSETSQNDNENEINGSQSTTQKTKISNKKEPANLTTIDENQSNAETEEDQSSADKTTTSAKGKTKKKKNNTNEPTTPDVS